MRRSLILNPLTVTVALAAVLVVGVFPRPLGAMPVKSQAAATVMDRDSLIERASEVLAIPAVREDLQRAGISVELAGTLVQRLSNEELFTLIDAKAGISEGQGSTGAVIAVLIGVAAVSYLVWRYTKWVDWYQSDLHLRN